MIIFLSQEPENVWSIFSHALAREWVSPRVLRWATLILVLIWMHYYGFFFYLSCLSLLWVTLTSCSSQVTHFNMFPFVFISHTTKFTVHDKIQITFTRYVWTLSRSACVCVNVWAAACVCARRKIFKFQSIFQIVVFNWLLCEVDYYLMQSVRGQLKCYVPSSCFPLWHKCLKYR